MDSKTPPSGEHSNKHSSTSQERVKRFKELLLKNLVQPHLDEAVDKAVRRSKKHHLVKDLGSRKN